MKFKNNKAINKIAVIGAGYVGMAMATLLSQKNKVQVYDIDTSKIHKINDRISTIADRDIQNFLKEKDLLISASSNFEEVVRDANFIIIATPTNYDELNDSFDTSNVEDTVQKSIKSNTKSTIVIKSTIPIGFTEKLVKRYNSKNILFSPEFLREGQALADNLNPSRLIIGGERNAGSLKFVEIIKEVSEKKDFPIIFMNPSEAESVKLFSNSYLAMRVSFFNELDSFAVSKGLDPENIIRGVSADPRIGDGYNNPSFGYGGYCLPKDTKQLLSEYSGIDQNIFSAIVKSNQTRKEFLLKRIVEKKPKTLGIYGLSMKSGSDNLRESATVDLVNELIKNDLKILIYEELISSDSFLGCSVIKDFGYFKSECDLILANRVDDKISHSDVEIFTRDIFNEN